MSRPIFVVDAFASGPFRGNPAAVVLLEAGDTPDVAWMQSVAAEMRHSETAYVQPRADGGFDLRWFTPEVEVDLCGHATLASGHVLWTEGHLPPEKPAWFQTRSGLLKAERRDDWIMLDLPVTPVQLIPGSQADPGALSEALGAA